ncbi:Hypothetical predicted protein [Podarcis lilfordi]|uniref:Uncharacterized protein n=1 Tax=Podarcis lilfordi TaxID=74358 RepID=A0AA35L2A3_9SAUR|nr:Hypothetical predicted protein [Podarcis lilfordi]
MASEGAGSATKHEIADKKVAVEHMGRPDKESIVRGGPPFPNRARRFPSTTSCSWHPALSGGTLRQERHRVAL